MTSFPDKPFPLWNGQLVTGMIHPAEIQAGDMLQLLDNIHGVEYQGGTVLVVSIREEEPPLSDRREWRPLGRLLWHLRLVGTDASVFDVTVDRHQYFILLERP